MTQPARRLAPPDERALTITDLMRRWQASRHTILDLIHTGRLKAFKLGRRTYRVALEEVLRYEREAS